MESPEEQKKSFLFYTLTYLWFRLLGLSGIVIRNFIDLRQHKFDENDGFSHKIPPCIMINLLINLRIFLLNYTWEERKKQFLFLKNLSEGG